MNFRTPYTAVFLVVAFTGVLYGSILISGCNEPARPYLLTGNAVVDGQNLARINCAKCHALVPVNALNKNVWKYHTLPSMAHYFKISTYFQSYYKAEKDTGGLSLPEWQSIVTYYEKTAPDTLTEAKKPIPLANDWAGFRLRIPQAGKSFSHTSMVAVNPANHKIYTSDGISGALTEWDNSLKAGRSVTLPSGAVDATFNTDASGNSYALLSCIGEMSRMDFPNGKVVRLDLDSKDSAGHPPVVIDDISRPVQTLAGDFNKDGRPDLVVLSQGYLKGAVYLFKQNPDHTYSQSTITKQPGAVQAIAGDFNGDGWQDLMVLFGSGNEGLWMYLNDRKGGFTSKNLLKFPPVYGSTSFQLADIDHDGKPDLIYSCGYNFNDSRILKPYHGLYIFKNTGNWNFKQQWFYPINGCTKAVAADFDGDGDIDIATSAFFADMQNDPAESLIYFEQIRPFEFKPYAIPVSKYGRWMSMQVADYNNDGKPDIILGNYSTGFLFQLNFKPSWNKYLPFIVLQNGLNSK